MECKISVIIPALTKKALVARTLNTVLRQTLQPLEILVCAVSTDAAEVLDSIRAEHGNISVFRDTAEALAAAHGEYVFFCSEHTVLSFSAFALLMERVQTNPRNPVSCGLAAFNPVDGHVGKRSAKVFLFSCLFETAALRDIAGNLRTPAGQKTFLRSASSGGVASIDSILVYIEAPDNIGARCAVAARKLATKFVQAPNKMSHRLSGRTKNKLKKLLPAGILAALRKLKARGAQYV
jgi:glycosyltransferase involved in cell wall biosynthesis